MTFLSRIAAGGLSARPIVTGCTALFCALLFAETVPALSAQTGRPEIKATETLAAKNLPILLLVSQREATEDARSFIDLAPHLVPRLEMSDKCQVIVCRVDTPAIQEAIKAGRLMEAAFTPPLSHDNAHRIAEAVQADFVLFAGSSAEKNGVTARMEMESRVGQRQWNSLFVQRLEPYRSKGKTKSVLEGVLAHTAQIIERVTGVPMKATFNGKSDVTFRPDTPDTVAKENAKQTPLLPPDKGTPVVKENSNGTNREARTDKPTGADVQKSDPNADVPRITPRPTGPTTNEVLVDRFRQTGDLSNLIVSLRRAINEKPRDARLRRDLVQAYTERGWQSAALEEARRAVAIAPEDPQIQRLLADSLMAVGENEDALQTYQKAVKLDSKNVELLVALGDAYWNNARPEQAQESYLVATQINPKNPLGFRRLARVYLHRGMTSDTAQAMKMAKMLLPAEDNAPIEEYNADFLGLLQIADTTLNELLTRMQTSQKLLVSGNKSREELFRDVNESKRRAEGMATLLDELPSTGPDFVRVQAMYAQAATLAVQSAESILLQMETQETRHEQEASASRIEARNQLANAAKRLKLLLPVRPEEKKKTDG